MVHFRLRDLNVNTTDGIDYFFHIIEVYECITVEDNTQMVLNDLGKKFRSAVGHCGVDLLRLLITREVGIAVTLDRNELNRTFLIIHAHDHDNVGQASGTVICICSGTAVDTDQQEVMDMFLFDRRIIGLRCVIGHRYDRTYLVDEGRVIYLGNKLDLIEKILFIL